MSNKELYQNFCSKKKGISIFALPKWLDLVCSDKNWKVVLYKKGDTVLGALPYIVQKRKGFTLITTPPLTQVLGVWYSDYTGKYAKGLKREKDISKSLLAQLPKHHVFFQSFHYNVTNWLPFYWMGFEQTTKYTYVIADLSSMNEVWKQTTDNTRNVIRKAEKELHLRTDLGVEEFYRILLLTYHRQGLTFPHSFDYIKNVIDGSINGGFGRMQFIVDNEGRVHAVLFLIWNEYSAHYLFGGTDPDLKNSGAGALNVWEAIKFSSEVTQAFDFEGTMVEGIERFFRGFGAEQKAYSRLRKFTPKWLSIGAHLQRLRTGKI